MTRGIRQRQTGGSLHFLGSGHCPRAIHTGSPSPAGAFLFKLGNAVVERPE